MASQYVDYLKDFWQQFQDEFIDFSLLTSVLESPKNGFKRIFPKRYSAQWKLVKAQLVFSVFAVVVFGQHSLLFWSETGVAWRKQLDLTGFSREITTTNTKRLISATVVFLGTCWELLRNKSQLQKKSVVRATELAVKPGLDPKGPIPGVPHEVAQPAEADAPLKKKPIKPEQPKGPEDVKLGSSKGYAWFVLSANLASLIVLVGFITTNYGFARSGSLLTDPICFYFLSIFLVSDSIILLWYLTVGNFVWISGGTAWVSVPRFFWALAFYQTNTDKGELLSLIWLGCTFLSVAQLTVMKETMLATQFKADTILEGSRGLGTVEILTALSYDTAYILKVIGLNLRDSVARYQTLNNPEVLKKKME